MKFYSEIIVGRKRHVLNSELSIKKHFPKIKVAVFKFIKMKNQMIVSVFQTF